MAAGHQVEGAVGEGQWWLPVIGDHDGAEWMQQRRRLGEVGRPPLRGDQRRREVLGSGAGQHLTTAGLDVQRRGGRGELPAEKPLIAPRRALLGGATVEPGEVPAFDRDRGRFVNELVERPHPDIRPEPDALVRRGTVPSEAWLRSRTPASERLPANERGTAPGCETEGRRISVIGSDRKPWG